MNHSEVTTPVTTDANTAAPQPRTLPQEFYDRARMAGALNAPDNRKGRRLQANFLRDETGRKRSAQLRNRCKGARNANGVRA